MRNKLLAFCFILALLFSNILMPIDDVHAANRATISITSSKTKVTEGDTFTVTVRVSSSVALGSWDFTIDYDTSKLTLVSSTLEYSDRSVGYTTNSTTKSSKDYKLTFKVKKGASGTTTIRSATYKIFERNETEMVVTEGKVSVTMQTQAQVDASKSTNRDLKSLSIEGHNLVPVFNAKTLEYSLEVENNVSVVNVKAEKADSKAKLIGTGTHDLVEGSNKLEIIVTAENGTRNIYTINVIRKELNPVIITIDGKEYTVVRKVDDIEIPSTFREIQTIINNEEVPAFESDITGYTLILLNDGENTDFYIIKSSNEYALYKEHKFSSITLFLLTPKESDIPTDYKSFSLKLGEEEITAYKLNDDMYPLIYGVNIETGESAFYTYDEKEGTLQRYNSIEITQEEEKSDNNVLLITLGTITFLSIISLVLVGIKRRKRGA